MRDKNDDEAAGGWEPGAGPVLDASGRVEQARPSPPLNDAQPPPARQEPEPERELELARDIRREEPPPSAWSIPEEHARPRRSLGRPLFAIGAVAALAASGWFFGPELWARASRHIPLGMRAEAAILKVESQPSGARVMVGETELGITPLMMDNVWPAGRTIELEVRLGGYQTWRGTIEGGCAQALEAKLKPGRSNRRSH